MKRYDHKYYIHDTTVRNAINHTYIKKVTWKHASKIAYTGIVLDTDVLKSAIIRALRG